MQSRETPYLSNLFISALREPNARIRRTLWGLGRRLLSQAQALYDCDSTDPDELSFKSGDVFVIVEDKGADWYQMRDAAGHVGLVPANYVKVL